MRLAAAGPARKAFFYILAVLIGLVASLAFIEGALRTAAWLISRSQENSNPRAGAKRRDEFRIVALGESTTAQWWSNGREESWPGELERILNAAGLGRRFKVFNLAKGGTSTSFLVAAFQQKIDELRPHAVISMMGINDTVRFEYFHERGLASLRIVKAARWTLQNLRAKNMEPPRAIDGWRVNETVLFIDRALGGLHAASAERIQSAKTKVLSRLAGPDENAATGFEHACYTLFDQAKRFEQDLAGEENAALRGERLGRAAFDFAAEGLAKNPTSAELGACLAYAGTVAHREKEAVETLHRSIEQGMKPNSTLFTLLPALGAMNDPALLAALREQNFSVNKKKSWYQITFENYRRLADLCHSRKIAYLAMQYPTGNIAAIKNIFSKNPRIELDAFDLSLYEKFPKQEISPEYKDVLFVGNGVFNDIVSPDNYGEYFSDRFGTARGMRFGHTTAKGHALIAKNAARAIIANWPGISRMRP